MSPEGRALLAPCTRGVGTILIDGAAGDVPIFSEFVYTGFATNRQWAQDNPEPALSRSFNRRSTR
ncbi:hypothetical protein [Pseudonocardia sp.]|uniref:hypothetical protein n=1 Tax=Pseudonocardia sp. TaxID=60912 RepID=UPI0031FDC6DD